MHRTQQAPTPVYDLGKNIGETIQEMQTSLATPPALERSARLRIREVSTKDKIIKRSEVPGESSPGAIGPIDALHAEVPTKVVVPPVLIVSGAKVSTFVMGQRRHAHGQIQCSMPHSSDEPRLQDESGRSHAF